MDFIIPNDMPIEVAYDRIREIEKILDYKYLNTLIKCECGCNETYLRKDEEKFRKTNLKHLIIARDKLIDEVEHWKGKVERGERERYFSNGENSDDGYDSDTTAGQPPAMLEETEEQLKDIEEVLKNLKYNNNVQSQNTNTEKNRYDTL